MAYDVRLHRSAAAYLTRLDRRNQERMRDRLHLLANDPFEHSKPLAGEPGRRSSRIGSWRIIFTVDTTAQTVIVSRIGPRGQVYRDR